MNNKKCLIFLIALLIQIFVMDAFAAAPVTTTRWKWTQDFVKTFATQSDGCVYVVSVEQANYPGWVVSGGIYKYPSAPFATPDTCTVLHTSGSYTQGPFSRGEVKQYTMQWCSDGSAPDTSKPLDQQCAEPDTKCAGYPTPLAAATNYAWLYQPITCSAINPADGVATCQGTDGAGKPSTQEIMCRGLVGPNPYVGPLPTHPDPPPQVNVSYPKCPPGSYEFIDIDGSRSCSKPMNPPAPEKCSSGNVGTVNGKYACLPANPAPVAAKIAEDAAKSKMETAKLNPGTDAAKSAANGAAMDAQRAAEAANSLPTSQQTQTSANNAIEYARQAAVYGGTSYNGPNSPQEQQQQLQCGAPGQPKCGIDETGTPNGNGAYDGAKGAVDQAYSDGKLGEITSDSGKDTSWGWVPLSWVSPGQCQPLNLGTMPVINTAIAFDMCPQLQTASELLTFIWAMGTIGLCIHMVWKTMMGTGE